MGRYTETEKSIIYLAPEVLKDLLKRNKEADVYSYGIMLWEMWHGAKAFTEIMPLEIISFRKRIYGGYRPPKRNVAINLPQSEQIMKWCWSFQPSERPSAKWCCQAFQDIIDSRETDNSCDN